MQRPTAQLYWKVLVNCPYCGDQFDLSEQDEDNWLSTRIFTNQWEKLEGAEVFCPRCSHEFEIDKVEY